MLCIKKEQIENFKKAIKDKKLDVFEMMKMSTEARTALISEFAGNNAKAINTLFEEKLILKNRIQGIKNWVNKTGELGRYDPIKKSKLDNMMSEYKARQQERMFNPKENEGFLADLVEEKLGVRITREEAKTAFDLQVKVDNSFKNADVVNEVWSSEKAAADYGAARQTYKKYIDGLKAGNFSVKDIFKAYGQEIGQLWKENKYEATKKIISDSISGLSKTTINAVASWDNSFMGRQGSITLIKSPKTWWYMAKKSMSDFYQTIKGNEPQDVLMAEIYSDFDYINGNYTKAKLSFGIEEEVPIQVLERIPVIGKVFKSSDVAFIDSAIRARRGLFKIQKQIYQKTGMALTDLILRDMGTVVNAITARGKMGQIGSSAPVQLLMWAPKMLKADWDILTAHTAGFGLETNFGRKQAAKTIANVIIATAGITAIAKAMRADVETNPESTDFLKIKIGNTRINTPFARGIPQIITLFSRLIMQETKNSSGIITKLNSGNYGSRSLFDVGIDFLVNKTTPPVGAVMSWFRGRNYAGQKPTVGNVAFGFIPISVQNFIGLKDEATIASVFGAFADLFGVSSNTYSQETDWGESTGVELNQFKEKVGETKFKEANDKFNKQYNDWLNSMKTNSEYKKLNDEMKQKVITKKKAEIKSSIFKSYNFKYTAPKTEKTPKF